MYSGTFYSLGKEDFEKSIHVEVASIDEEEELSNQCKIRQMIAFAKS
jgi:hypothetical protein